MDKGLWDRVNELKELAQKATPGVWIYDKAGNNIGIYPQKRAVFWLTAGENNENDANYAAAASPAMILEMVEEFNHLQKKLNDMKAHTGRQTGRIKILEENLERLGASHMSLEARDKKNTACVNALAEKVWSLKKEAAWLASYIGRHECVKGEPESSICPDAEACKECWREEAARAVQAEGENKGKEGSDG